VLSRSSLLVTAALVAAGLGALACSSEAPTGVAEKPDLSIQSIDCRTVPNGGVVKVNTEPASIDMHWHNYANATAQVFRDDPNTPGVQIYCQDFVVAVVWTANGVIRPASTPGPQSITIFSNQIGSAKLIAALSGHADTTNVTVVF
jgi:hypothetical protein